MYLTPNPKHLYIYAINRLHIIRELETRDGVNITNWFSKIKVDGNTIIWPPLEEITDNPVSVKAKLDNISFGREITVIKSDGYQVNPGYDRFDHRMMEAHTTFMRESPNLAVTYDPVMIAQLADGLLNQGKSRVLKN